MLLLTISASKVERNDDQNRSLRQAARQYYYANQAEIRAAPRLRAYLAQRTTINKFRQLIVQRNEAIRDWDVTWKTRGKTFIGSLPELPF